MDNIGVLPFESLMPHGANLFMYCYNNPVKFADSSGRRPISFRSMSTGGARSRLSFGFAQHLLSDGYMWRHRHVPNFINYNRGVHPFYVVLHNFWEALRSSFEIIVGNVTTSRFYTSNLSLVIHSNAFDLLTINLHAGNFAALTFGAGHASWDVGIPHAGAMLSLVNMGITSNYASFGVHVGIGLSVGINDGVFTFSKVVGAGISFSIDLRRTWNRIRSWF